jgi:hypothetical protein
MAANTSQQPTFREKALAALKRLFSFRLDKLAPAFWTVTSIISLTVNVILIALLLILGQHLFSIKALVGDNLLRGLYENFILMDQAYISTVIPVETEVPVQFDLPVRTTTTVVLTENVRITGARVVLQTGGLQILDAPTSIILPAGSSLPISLDIVVPVDTTIPIKLDVAVDIPLKDTELHQPFVGLQKVIGPLYWLFAPNIKEPSDLPFCQSNPAFCDAYFILP